MHDPLRVAVVGYGLAGSLFHAPFIAAVEGLTVSAVVTSDPQRQDAARHAHPAATVFRHVDELWAAAPEHDAVVIATPNRHHVPLARAALAAGLAVVVDKPLAASATDGAALVAEAAAAGRPLTVFQNRRFDGDFTTLQAVLASGELGELLRVESRFERWRPLPKAGAWREDADPAQAGGQLFDLGAHLIDQALLLLGQPESVYAESDRRRAGVTVDDDTFVAITFPGGRRAHLWTSMLAAEPGPRFIARGSKGTFVCWGLDPQEPALQAGARPGAPGWVAPVDRRATVTTDAGTRTIDVPAGRWETFYERWRDALRGVAPVPVDPADAVRGLQVIEAARHSAASGTVVTL